MTARAFTPLAGGGCRLKVTFASNPSERIYGMGQYQQEQSDLKGCNLVLAHRNSQCSMKSVVELAQDVVADAALVTKACWRVVRAQLESTDFAF